jgi:hypothetical protein
MIHIPLQKERQVRKFTGHRRSQEMITVLIRNVIKTTLMRLFWPSYTHSCHTLERTLSFHVLLPFLLMLRKMTCPMSVWLSGFYPESKVVPLLLS